MEQLVVRLGTTMSDPVHWVVWSTQDQDVIASGELPDASALASLTERTRLRKALVLVPGADVRLCQVDLPPKANRKILNAIPFMLEDELADDISELFFAFGPKTGNKQAVAIVSHEAVAQWRQWIEDAGFSCDTMLPDTLALPQPDDQHWSAIALGEQLIVRQGSWQGIQGETDFMTSVLAFQAKQIPEGVTVTALSDIDLHAVPNIRVVADDSGLPPAGKLAKAALSASFNLLQGQYKVKKQHNQVWQFWRTPAILLGLVLVLTIGEKVLHLQQLEQQNDELSAQIDAVIKQGFPDLGTYRNARTRIEREIRELEQGGSGSSLLVMLAQLNNAFASSQVTPQTIRFDANRTEIRMQAEGKDFNALQAFKRGAEAAGFSVEEGAINNRDDKVIGTMAIKGA
tara:strand:+ start:17802 stop:19004 length:1203 start_codon:yes stop_codon:yes gene_type:complete